MVDDQRRILSRVGTRKLHYLISEQLAMEHIKFGSDKLFTLMKRHGLLIQPIRRYVQTTMSRHWLRKWPNLMKTALIEKPDTVWVSDITYIKTLQGNCYLNMVTDAYSRKIVGYAVDTTMEAESMVMALKMAVRQKKNNVSTIHHSDRGLQYCSKEYVDTANANNIRLSMTENSDPYENALAERMNRTIKEEFGLGRILLDIQQVKALIKEAVKLYNTVRPHLALKMLTPEDVYSKIN